MAKVGKQVLEAFEALDQSSRSAFESAKRRDMGMVSPLPLLAALAARDLHEAILGVGASVSWQALYLFPEQFELGDEPIDYPEGAFIEGVFLEHKMFDVLRLALSIAKAQEQITSIRISPRMLLAALAIDVFRRDASVLARLELIPPPKYKQLNPSDSSCSTHRSGGAKHSHPGPVDGGLDIQESRSDLADRIIDLYKLALENLRGKLLNDEITRLKELARNLPS